MTGRRADGMMLGVSRLRVEIEAIELHGFDPAHRFVIVQAFEHELSQLLGERGPSAGATGADAREATVPGLSAATSPRHVGVALARAVYAVVVPTE